MNKRQFSTEELAFLAAIRDDPCDDAVRLIYADWLAEHGRPEFAEVIRLQCENPCLAMNIGPNGPRIWRQLRRMVGKEELRQAEHIRTLLRPIYKDLFLPVPTGAKRVGRFIRGLPTYTAIIADADHARWDFADRLLAKVNPYGTFRLTLITQSVEAWVDHPLMRLVSDLTIFLPGRPGKEYLTAKDMQALAESSLPERLTALTIDSQMPPAAERVYRKRLEPRISNCFPC
jgi:uncharacterized protein (TIGR02996 family)